MNAKPSSSSLGKLDPSKIKVPTPVLTKKQKQKESRELELLSSEKTPLKLYLKQISQYPLLTIDEENVLAKKIHRGDEKAKSKMIRSNLRLVVKIAQDYNFFGLPFLDLIAEGNIGLMKAVERFDPEKGGKLSTYAAWWIKQSIKRALANQKNTIRLPVHLIQKISDMRKAEHALEEKLKREPSNDELADALKVTASRVAHLKTVASQPASLDATVGEDEKTKLSELVGDENVVDPSDTLRRDSTADDIQQLVDQLGEREAMIIKMRFGLNNTPPRTLEEIGDHLGLTRERVRQLQNETLKVLRDQFLEGIHQNTPEEIEQKKAEISRMQVFKEFIESLEQRNTEAPEVDCLN